MLCESAARRRRPLHLQSRCGWIAQKRSGAGEFHAYTYMHLYGGALHVSTPKKTTHKNL